MVLAVRRWQSEVSADLDELAHEIAWFITVSEVEAGATVLVRRAGRSCRGRDLNPHVLAHGGF